MTASDTPFDYQVGGDDELSIRRIGTHGPQSGTIGPRPEHVVFWLTDGRARVTSDGGGTWDVGAERPMMLSAPVAYGFDTDATAMTLMHLSPGLLGDGDGQTEFGQPDAADPRIEPLRALLRDVTGRVLDAALPADQRAALNRRIATVVLSTFVPARSDVEHRMRRAIRFVHDEADRPVTVADVAAACGLSERGVQDLFRRRLGVTPMQYLREVRLDRVHLELGRSRSGASLVSDVARRWQFAHLGRFAAHYRARFGEQPHETIARGPGAV
ncbi:helix-turn-helix transcriptional regulator [Curtobacterium sp. VKM Ac-1393]|uniref:helix-turn-helix transcriptional regulator n=1 Tax=Curtobacterium sp. VKM Ac-1393 TaxID=2783814 RepID=UPI00188B0BD5|nr:helix-turn-helix transcriptional regulator [Curtobacterium sp. VKM Ac-1393]MBF4606038.1 helix-turn-helix transcriptional regulator [Curtobacterium sp. VKM Ac-1393]